MPTGLCTLWLLSLSMPAPTGEGTALSLFVKPAGVAELSLLPEEDDGYDCC